MKGFYKSVFMTSTIIFCLFFLASPSQGGGATQYPTYDIPYSTYSPSPYGYYSGYSVYRSPAGGYLDYGPTWGGYPSYGGYPNWSSGGYGYPESFYGGFTGYDYPGSFHSAYPYAYPYIGDGNYSRYVSLGGSLVPREIFELGASSNWNTAQKGYELSLPYIQSAVMSGWTPYSQWYPSSPSYTSYTSSTAGYRTLTGKVVGSNSIEVKGSVIKCWTIHPAAATSREPLDLSGYRGSVVEVSGFQTANDLYEAKLERVVY